MKLYTLAADAGYEGYFVEGIFTTKEKALDGYKKIDSDWAQYFIYEVDANVCYEDPFNDCVSWNAEELIHPENFFTI